MTARADRRWVNPKPATVGQISTGVDAGAPSGLLVPITAWRGVARDSSISAGGISDIWALLPLVVWRRLDRLDHQTDRGRSSLRRVHRLLYVMVAHVRGIGVWGSTVAARVA